MTIAIFAFIIVAILISNILVFITVNPIQAETGKGEDIFKVIMTVFGLDESKGDIVAIVTVNNGEASKVKFLDTDLLLTSSNLTTSTPSTTNPAPGGGIIEYVATFPNVTVNVGNEYKACAIPVKNLELMCSTGNNSPAQRPEFVDISLNATTSPGSGLSEEAAEDSNEGDEE
jgi:hypothetical protein